MTFGLIILVSYPNQKKHRAAHSAAHGQPMGSRVGCPWAAHAHGQFAMQMSSLPTVLYISWELPMGCPWAGKTNLHVPLSCPQQNSGQELPTGAAH